MPDPLLYLKSIAAAYVAAFSVLAVCFARRNANQAWINPVFVCAIGGGLAVGLSVMSMQSPWPPVSGLDRLLVTIIPITLGVELVSAIRTIPRWLPWLLRTTLVLITPRILLHGSVYLSEFSDWTMMQGVAVIGSCCSLLFLAWGLMSKLSLRRPGHSIPFALCLALLSAGATVMMGGYIKGGAVVLPFIASLLAALTGIGLIRQRANGEPTMLPPVIIAVGVVGLFGVLFIGHFFGRVSAGSAITIFVAPLLCWVSETATLKSRGPNVTAAVGLSLVCVPLVIILLMAKRDFDVDLSPLVQVRPVVFTVEPK